MVSQGASALVGRWRSRGGQGLILRAGAALAGFALSIAAVTGGWTVIAHYREHHSLADDTIRLANAALGPAVASALAEGDVELARRVIGAAGQHHGLTRVRVLLPDGQAVVSADPSAALFPLPERGAAVWSMPRTAGGAAAVEGELLVSRTPVEVAGLGAVTLEVATTNPGETFLNLETMVGLGAAAVLGVGAWAVTFRWLVRRLRAVAAIRAALEAMQAGETQTGALTVGPSLGPEAHAWNQLLAERDRLRAQAAVDQARETREKRGRGSGELAQACDALWHGVVVLDEKQRIVYANSAAAAFLGQKRDRLGEGTFGQHVPDQGVLEALHQMYAGKLRRRTSVEVRRGGDQPGVLRFSLRPVGKDEAGGVVVFVEDVTQQRIADESRNSFVAQATHELRTPLTNIRLYVEQAIEAGEGDPRTRADALNVINQESLRLERIVADMLSVSEIEAGSLKIRGDDVRLDALLEDLKAEFAPQALQKEILLQFDVPPKLPVIAGDRDKIAQALHNLLGNGLKYTPRGGTVTVKVEATAERLSVDVADSGIGIAPDEQELVFQKFYRAKDERVSSVVGTGLGLPLAREVARLHGGDVTVRSELNRGSTFTFSIPLGESPAAARAA